VPLINLFSRISIFNVFEETLQSVLQCQIMFDPKDQVQMTLAPSLITKM